MAHLSAIIETPESNPPHVEWRGIKGVQRQDEVDQGVVRVRLTASDLPVTRAPQFGPPEIVPPEVTFSTVPNWQQVATWYSGIVERQVGTPAPKTGGDPTDRLGEVETILADVQSKVRYTGVELGMAAYVPRSPAETLERGYGDCKDKAVLLVSRLRAAGINAELVLVTPYPYSPVWPEIPGIEAFNHAIVYVPGKRPLWIDPTSEFTPASRLPAADQGRMGLIIDPNTTELVRTPENVATQNRSLQRHEIALTEEGAPNISMTLEVTGALEDTIRALANAALEMPEDQRARAYNQIGNSGTIGKVISVDWGAPKDLGHPARITIKGEKYARAGGTEQLAYVFTSDFGSQVISGLATMSDIARDKDRTDDVVLPLLSSTEELWKVIPPPGFKLKQVPSLKNVELGPLTLQREASAEPDGSVTFRYGIESSRKRYTITELRQVSEAVSKLRSERAIRVDFVPEGSQLMSDGKWKEGIERLRKDAEAVPQTAHSQLRYAAALSQVGLRDRAIEVYRKAIELDPNSAEAWARLSFAYGADQVGRFSRAGRDFGQAEKAIQKAIELNPKEPRYVAQFATLMQWKGSARFEDSAALAESIKLIESIAKDLPTVAPDALPEALLHAGRYEEGKQFYARDEAKASRADLKLATLAAADGVSDAMRESERLGQSEDVRKTTLKQAAQYLLAVREYAKAAELFSAGVDSSILSSDIDLLSRSRRRTEATLSKDPVIATVQKAIYALGDPDLRPEFGNLIAPEWRELDPLVMRNELLGIFAPFARIAGQALGSRATADIVVSTAEFSSEGSDELGYRIRFADPSANGQRKTVAWVVQRDGSYRILGFRNDAALIGGEALALAKKGTLDGARRWLDWQREEMTTTSLTDPLGGDVFARLWPATDPSGDAILAAAATLVSRGPHFEEGIDVLREVSRRATDRTFAGAVNQALSLALTRRAKYAEALPTLQELHKQYPMSEVGLTSLVTALTLSGKPEDSIELLRNIDPISPLHLVALRLRARSDASRGEYKDAVEIYRTIAETKNLTAGDWNNMAWATLFLPGEIEPNLEWAQRAIQLSQGRDLPAVQTLASVQAEVGKLKEARESILRYIGQRDPIDQGTWYVMGRIAEQLGFANTATAMYAKIKAPDVMNGVTLYDLAKVRISTIALPK